LPYDGLSIMHYESHDFSVDRHNPEKNTIVSKMNEISTNELGKSEWLTDIDVQKLEKMYNCKSKPKQVTCKSGEFKCSNGEKCIKSSYKCDEENDCGDNSDERNCQIVHFTDNHEECKNKCETDGESYNWCYKVSGSWDYCTPLGGFKSADFHARHFAIDNKNVRFSSVRKSWTEAQRVCSNNGGRLFEPRSSRQNMEVANTGREIVGSGYVEYWWIGVDDRNSEGRYVWTSTKNEINFENWIRQPNNDGNENFVGMITHSDPAWHGKWFDHFGKRPFVCEFT